MSSINLAEGPPIKTKQNKTGNNRKMHDLQTRMILIIPLKHKFLQ